MPLSSVPSSPTVNLQSESDGRDYYISLFDARLQKLKEIAVRFGVAPEGLVCVSAVGRGDPIFEITCHTDPTGHRAPRRLFLWKI